MNIKAWNKILSSRVLIIAIMITTAGSTTASALDSPTSPPSPSALPNSQVGTTFWLPWYNNVDLDTQLRFGRP